MTEPDHEHPDSMEFERARRRSMAYIQRDNREYEVGNLFDDGLEDLAAAHITEGDFDEAVMARALALGWRPWCGARQRVLEVAQAFAARVRHLTDPSSKRVHHEPHEVHVAADKAWGLLDLILKEPYPPKEVSRAEEQPRAPSPDEDGQAVGGEVDPRAP